MLLMKNNLKILFSSLNVNLFSTYLYSSNTHMDIDELKGKISYKWLRDNCRCSECLHPLTLQRQFNSIELSNIKENELPVIYQEIKNDKVSIVWKNCNHKSEYPISFLNDTITQSNNLNKYHDQIDPLFNISPNDNIIDEKVSLWDKNVFLDDGKVNYDKLPMISIKSNTCAKKYVDALDRYGFAILTGFNCNSPDDSIEETKNWIKDNVGPFRNTFYGNFWDLTVKSEAIDLSNKDSVEHQDTAYLNTHLNGHTDGTYFVDPPALQYFRFLEHNGTGGETILVDSFNIADDLKTNHNQIFNYLINNPFLFHYTSDDKHLRIEELVYKLHPISKKLSSFRYNNDDRFSNIITESPQLEAQYYQAIETLMSKLLDETNILKIKLEPDQLLTTFNWRVCHGRTSFTGNRRMIGCYVNYDEFNSCRLKQT